MDVEKGLSPPGAAVDPFLLVPEAVKMVNLWNSPKPGIEQRKKAHKRVVNIDEINRRKVEYGVDVPFYRGPKPQNAFARPGANSIKLNAVDQLVIRQPLGGFASNKKNTMSALYQTFVHLVGVLPGSANLVGVTVELER